VAAENGGDDVGFGSEKSVAWDQRFDVR